MKNISPLKVLLPAYYFFYIAGLASLNPFLGLYYRQRGLTGTEIGILSAIPPLVSLVAAPLWSGIADATRRHKAVFFLASGSVILTALTIYNASTLIWLIPTVAGFSFFAAPIMPLIDSNTMLLLEGRRNQYGRIRLWGTIGWAVAAPIVGWLIQHSGIAWSFYTYAILIGVSLLIALPIPMGHSQVAVPFWSGLRVLLSNRRWVFFLGMIFLIGIGAASVSTYLFIHLKNLGADEPQVGLALTLSTVSEVPMFFFSERILRRFKWRGLILIALPIYVIRLLLYSVVSSPSIILVIQLLHGLTIPTIWAAGISYVAETAPPGLSTTAQGMFAGVMNGLGSATGAYLGGVIFQNFGPVVMFRTFAVVLFTAFLLFWLLEKRISNPTPTSQ